MSDDLLNFDLADRRWVDRRLALLRDGHGGTFLEHREKRRLVSGS